MATDNGQAERMNERVAIVETQLLQSCKDIDSLFEVQRKFDEKMDFIVRKTTAIDEHLKNGLGMRIIKGIDEHLTKKKQASDRALKWILGIFAVIETASFLVERFSGG